MNTKSSDLRVRTRDFALRVVSQVGGHIAGRAVGRRDREAVATGATSMAANYRAACRARSTAEFASKMGIVEEEADESVYWLELLRDAGIVPAERIADLTTEGGEIVAMVVASIKTARGNRKA